jgi:hypothetical protein
VSVLERGKRERGAENPSLVTVVGGVRSGHWLSSSSRRNRYACLAAPCDVPCNTLAAPCNAMHCRAAPFATPCNTLCAAVQ